MRPGSCTSAMAFRCTTRGENVTGTPVLLGTEPGTITVIFSEALGADGLPDPEHHHGQKAIFHIREPRTLRAIGTWYGYRYFSVQGPAQVLCCEVIHSKVPATSTFHAPEPTLQWLYDAFLRTQLANMHAGIPSDCPHLERRGYTGDGQLVCEAGMMLLGSRDFYRKWLRDIADCQDRKTGHMQYTAPYTRCGGGPAAGAAPLCRCPINITASLATRNPCAKCIRKCCAGSIRWRPTAKAGSSLPISRACGAWEIGACRVSRAFPSRWVNTYFYIRSLRQACAIAEILGIDGERALLKERIAGREKALYQRYYDPQTGDFAENAQGANAFMVDLGLGDARTLEHIAQRYAALGEYDTGIFGTDIVTRVLFERGHKALAAKLLTSCGASSYGHMRLTGATTLYEYWHGGRSYSHPMFGAPGALSVSVSIGPPAGGRQLRLAGNRVRSVPARGHKRAFRQPRNPAGRAARTALARKWRGARGDFRARVHQRASEGYCMLNPSEIAVLRQLASEYAQAASQSGQRERRQRWLNLNHLRGERPLVLIDQIPWEEMDVDGSLVCQVRDPYWRGVETGLRQNAL